MSAKVFISHSSNDHKAAQTICTALEHRGLVCWMASRDVGPGQNYMDAIVRAIRDAKVMVLVFSQNANISDEILKELSLASKYKVNVIPARIEDVVPSEAFELEFATRQWIDLFDNWEREIERLTSWIISIVSIEPNTDAAAKRAGTAVHPGPPPIPKPPQALIIENRSELLKSESETPTIDKKEESLPSDNATKSQTTPLPEELRDIKQAKEHRRADEERARRQVEAKRLAEEEERRAKEEEDRERRQEAEVKRRADEQEHRRQAEAEARRRTDDDRRAEEAEAKRRVGQGQAFSAAKSTDTVSAVDNFLVDYPECHLAGEARALRAKLLTRDEAHRQAMASDDPTVFKEFLGTYPSGSPADEVRRRLRRLEPQPVWRPSTRTLVVAGALVVGLVGIWLGTSLLAPVVSAPPAIATAPPSVQPSPADQAILLDPKDAGAYNNRANAYAAKGDYDRAIKDYDQAILLDPKNDIAYNNRGLAHAAKGDYDRAIADYNQAILLDPKYAIGYISRGLAYAARGDNDRAITDYNQAILLDPKEAAAYINRGNAYKRKGNYDRAIKDYDQAIKVRSGKRRRMERPLLHAYNHRPIAGSSSRLQRIAQIATQ
jgi:tetratricopeptide (TPR) repeat protein